MRFALFSRAALLVLGCLPMQTIAGGTLSTKGIMSCMADPDIHVQTLDVSYTRATKEVKFNLAGSNDKEQKVVAKLTVQAYGREIYSNQFDPCSPDYNVDSLCPVPARPFSASGTQQIPESYASQIP